MCVQFCLFSVVGTIGHNENVVFYSNVSPLTWKRIIVHMVVPSLSDSSTSKTILCQLEQQHNTHLHWCKACHSNGKEEIVTMVMSVSFLYMTTMCHHRTLICFNNTTCYFIIPYFIIILTVVFMFLQVIICLC